MVNKIKIKRIRENARSRDTTKRKDLDKSETKKKKKKTCKKESDHTFHTLRMRWANREGGRIGIAGK